MLRYKIQLLPVTLIFLELNLSECALYGHIHTQVIPMVDKWKFQGSRGKEVLSEPLVY